MTKFEARILAKAKRDNLDKTNKIIKDKIIVKKIEQNNTYKISKLIGVYSPFGSEVNISDLKHKYAKFAYPKINNGKMNFILVNNKTRWEVSNYGILEPVNGKIVNDEIDLLLVSSLSKNKNNYRLGYGKGYYDKFIKEYKPRTIGILYDNYTLEFIEDLWDIALDDYISN